MDMEILRYVAAALIVVVISVYFRKQNEDYAVYISIAAGMIILGSSLSYLYPVLAVVRDYAAKSNITNLQLSSVLKILATAYLAQFASDICTDANNSSLANKVEIAARFMIAYLSLPIVLTLFEYISTLM
ncbi:MAG: stage III sporulation AC/AD family protein [Eubacteriaceae bacterium]|jgi:stage III sporulation protein AD|nr:stage III sporulation AC/AD family protein [Eubacteriaceae bacterium]